MNIKALLIVFVTAIVLDFVWLGYVVQSFYVNSLRGIVRVNEQGRVDVVYWAAFLCYLFIALGVVYFALPKVNADDSIFRAFMMGAFFGFVAYGIYDMTNAATLVTWPPLLAAADILWGAVLCGTATALAFKLG